MTGKFVLLAVLAVGVAVSYAQTDLEKAKNLDLDKPMHNSIDHGPKYTPRIAHDGHLLGHVNEQHWNKAEYLRKLKKHKLAAKYGKKFGHRGENPFPQLKPDNGDIRLQDLDYNEPAIPKRIQKLRKMEKPGKGRKNKDENQRGRPVAKTQKKGARNDEMKSHHSKEYIKKMKKLLKQRYLKKEKKNKANKQNKNKKAKKYLKNNSTDDDKKVVNKP